MPFIRIDTLEGRYDERQRAIISDVLFAAVQTIGAKPGDRFQSFCQHAPGSLIFDSDYLGIVHSEGFIAIQITLVAGRSVEQKKGLYAFVAQHLQQRVGIRLDDVFITLIETAPENWSFGKGEAQYAPHA